MLTNGALVERFETACAERLGVAHCVAVSSCTSGLLLTLKALDLHGEVILPSLTFFATGHATLWNGLTPVFADCDPESWCLDPQKVQQRITERTSAILGVHLYGIPCDVAGLEAVASANGLKLIFDAAHAFGSSYQGLPIGQFGDAEVFSFTPTKMLVCGEGGLVATNDATLARRVRLGRNYGDSGTYDPELLGCNARMPEFNAAMGLAGLSRVDAKVERHNAIAQAYEARLGKLPGIQFPKVRTGDVCTYKDVSLCVNRAAFGMDRDELAAHLLEAGIDTKKYFFPPVHSQQLYREYSRSGLEHTRRISAGVLSLPVYKSLQDEEVERVIRAVEAVAHRSR